VFREVLIDIARALIRGGRGRRATPFRHAEYVTQWAVSMTGKHRFSRWLLVAALFAAVDCAGVVAIEAALMSSAQAQFPFFGGQQQQHRSRSGGGFFGGLFGGFDRHSEPYEQQQAPVDNSRAPAPRKPDPKAAPITVTTSIVVLGDAMADWLAYGMEDAFADSPEIAIIRKNKVHSGLTRYEKKADSDWGGCRGH